MLLLRLVFVLMQVAVEHSDGGEPTKSWWTPDASPLLSSSRAPTPKWRWTSSAGVDDASPAAGSLQGHAPHLSRYPPSSPNLEWRCYRSDAWQHCQIVRWLLGHRRGGNSCLFSVVCSQTGAGIEAWSSQKNRHAPLKCFVRSPHWWRLLGYRRWLQVWCIFQSLLGTSMITMEKQGRWYRGRVGELRSILIPDTLRRVLWGHFRNLRRKNFTSNSGGPGVLDDDFDS